MPEYTAPDGTRLHYTDEGTGLPLLCLAGLTRNSSDFDYLAGHLSNVRLIRPDYRGRGRSQWADPSTYTIPTEAQDVLALLDRLELERVAVLGTSRGGLIAMLLATTHRKRLRGICLNDIGPEIAPGGLAAIRAHIGLQPAARTMEEAERMISRRIDGFANVPRGRWQQEAQRHYVPDADGVPKINYDPRLRDAFLAADSVAPFDLWPIFGALDDLPLALIRGENSDLLTLQTVEKMRERRPDMIYAEVPDRGHVPFLDEEPALYAIQEFLEQCR